MKNVDAVDILMVEDNQQHIDLTLRALNKHNLGTNVVSVKDGAEALDFLFARDAYSERKIEDAPKVIFLDLKLPKVDGLEVLRRIKSDERTKTIPVVVLTTSQQEQDIAQSYHLGANSYVVKPVNFDKFMQCISELAHYWVLCNQPRR